jgi:hypothetical protein
MTVLCSNFMQFSCQYLDLDVGVVIGFVRIRVGTAMGGGH